MTIVPYLIIGVLCVVLGLLVASFALAARRIGQRFGAAVGRALFGPDRKA